MAIIAAIGLMLLTSVLWQWKPTNTRLVDRGEPITLEEAVRIAAPAAKTWRPTAKVQFLTSQDSKYDLKAQSPPGLDGRRRAWGVQFVDPTNHEVLIVQILDSQIHSVIAAGTDSRPGLEPDELHVSSVELARLAADNGLKPGVTWAVGYHFDLVYDYDHGQYWVEVLGKDSAGRGHSLRFDPRTGPSNPVAWSNK
jgi:hypothetical protein